MNDCYSWDQPSCAPSYDPCAAGGACPATVDWFWWLAAAAAVAVIVVRSK